MAKISWLGGAAKVRQESRATPASVGVGNIFTIEINGKQVSYTAEAATVADVTAGLAARCAASTEPEFTEVSFSDQTTYVGLTGPTDGRPFTFAASASGGSATNVHSTPTAASGPNSWSTAANWLGGVAPVGGDDVVIDNSAVSILYDINTIGATFASITVGPGFTGEIGLPERNKLGYAEYRNTHLKIRGCPVSVNAPQCGRIKLFSQTSAITLNVFATGASADPNYPALLWYDNAVAGNAVNVNSGSAGVALLPGQTATLTTLRAGGSNLAAPLVQGGLGLTLTTFENNGGIVTLKANTPNIRQVDGTLTMLESATCGTLLQVDGGTVDWRSNGTITAATVGNGGTITFAVDIRPRTVTNVTLNAGAAWLDPARTVTYTNPMTLNRCAIADLRAFDVGTHVTVAVAAAA